MYINVNRWLLTCSTPSLWGCSHTWGNTGPRPRAWPAVSPRPRPRSSGTGSRAPCWGCSRGWDQGRSKRPGQRPGPGARLGTRGHQEARPRGRSTCRPRDTWTWRTRALRQCSSRRDICKHNSSEKASWPDKILRGMTQRARGDIIAIRVDPVTAPHGGGGPGRWHQLGTFLDRVRVFRTRLGSRGTMFLRETRGQLKRSDNEWIRPCKHQTLFCIG